MNNSLVEALVAQEHPSLFPMPMHRDYLRSDMNNSRAEASSVHEGPSWLPKYMQGVYMGSGMSSLSQAKQMGLEMVVPNSRRTFGNYSSFDSLNSHGKGVPNM